jgi:hypothetical protein
MSRSATLECPDCDHSEYPLRHTYQSSCGGVVSWRSGTLRCDDCDMEIYKFRCDNCGSILDDSDVS